MDLNRRLIILYFTMVSCLVEGSLDSKIYPPDPSTYERGGTITYIMFTQTDATFNEARHICQQFGGDLASLKTQEVLDTLLDLVNDAYVYSDFFKNDYWIGIVRPSVNETYWVSDCSVVDYTSPYISSRFTHAFSANELCMRNKKEDHTSERRPCDSRDSFLCEISSNDTCPYATRIQSSAKVSNSTTSTCENECNNNNDCWGTVKVETNKACVLLMGDSTGPDLVNITSKYCLNVELNTSTIVVPANNSKIPNHSCNSTLPETSTTITPTSVITSSTVAPSSSSSFIICPTVTLTPSPSYVTDTVSVTVDRISTSVAYTTLYTTIMTSLWNTVTTTQICSTETLTVTPTPVFVTEIVTVTDTQISTIQSMLTSCSSSVTVNPVTSLPAHVIASITEELIRNLSIDARRTSAYLRTLISAEDTRAASKYIGFVGVIVVAVPMATIVMSDCAKIFRDIRSGPTNSMKRTVPVRNSSEKISVYNR
ncbi:hypothetical protein ACF0H5_012979 [Mactra antiquata]